MKRSSPSEFASQGRKEKCRRPFRGICKLILGGCLIFVSSLAEEYTGPYYRLICCGVAISLLLTLPALHLWRLRLQQQSSKERSQQGSRLKEQLLLLQVRLTRGEGEQARSCRCQRVPHPCCQPSRQGNTACPSRTMGTTCVLDVAQLDQTQLAQPKQGRFEALIKTK